MRSASEAVCLVASRSERQSPKSSSCSDERWRELFHAVECWHSIDEGISALPEGEEIENMALGRSAAIVIVNSVVADIDSFARLELSTMTLSD